MHYLLHKKEYFGHEEAIDVVIWGVILLECIGR